MLTLGTGRTAPDWREALDTAYEKGETDEFVHPTVIDETSGQPLSLIHIFYRRRRVS